MDDETQIWDFSFGDYWEFFLFFLSFSSCLILLLCVFFLSFLLLPRLPISAFLLGHSFTMDVGSRAALGT